jgi:phosphatidate cytidylyltransferase
LKQRIITGLVGIAVLILIFWLGERALFLLLLGVHTLCVFEYFSLIYEHHFFHIAFAVIIGTITMFTFRQGETRLILPVVCTGFILTFSKDITFKRTDPASASLSIWGYIYISVFTSASLVILNKSIWLFALILISTIFCDSFAYFGGYYFGKHKLSPHISPNKTVEGAITGFIFALIIFSGVGYYFRDALNLSGMSLFDFALTGALIGICTQYGDLCASMVKRKFGIKDFSNLLPGHGGILDRIDGMLFSFAACYIHFSFLNLL